MTNRCVEQRLRKLGVQTFDNPPAHAPYLSGGNENGNVAIRLAESMGDLANSGGEAASLLGEALRNSADSAEHMGNAVNIMGDTAHSRLSAVVDPLDGVSDTVDKYAYPAAVGTAAVGSAGVLALLARLYQKNKEKRSQKRSERGSQPKDQLDKVGEDLEVTKRISVKPLDDLSPMDPARDVRRKTIAEAYKSATGKSAPLSFSNPGLSDLARDLLVMFPSMAAGKIIGEATTGNRLAGSLGLGLGAGGGLVGSRYLWSGRDNKKAGKLIEAIKKAKADKDEKD